MKAKISAMMDGELGAHELEDPIRALRNGGEALDTWRKYHLISDAMRDTQVLSSGFSARFSERLAAEPTILAPVSMARRSVVSRHRLPLSIAASAAGVAFVGLLAFQGFGPQPDINVAGNKTAERPVAAAIQVVPMPGQVNDYLLAHQNYSPRSALQGVAPYVRTVSDPARPR